MPISIACTVARHGSVEVRVGVVVSDGVVEGVGGNLVRVHLGDSVGNGVGNSVGNHRGMVDNRGGMDKRGSVGNAMAHYSVANKTGVASKSMPNHSRGPEDLRGRRGGGCKGCQSNEGLHPG